MVAALILASCAPAAPPEEKPAPPTEEKPAPPKEEKPAVEKPSPPEEEAEMVKVRLTKADGTVVEKSVEKPRYGGVFNMCWTREPLLFDDALGHPYFATTTFLTHDVVLQGNWARGPAGTGEAGWALMVWPEIENLRGGVVDTWERPDEDTLVYHIRQGIHFHNKPPTNGRELTADDVAFSLNRLWTLKTSIYLANPYIESIEATDKWTVVVKSQPGQMGVIYRYSSQYPKMMPRDAIEYYGDMNNWENEIGSGPYTIVDYVSGSSATLKRFPDYWDYDPVHPENQLPYLDTVKYLIIPDVSTRLAALRTARIDWLTGVLWEDADSLAKTNPELKHTEVPSQMPPAIMWRVDRPELPFHDIKVRQALFMAVDHEAIAKEFYGGHATVHDFPALDIPEFSAFYIKLEDRAPIVQKMYGYHPDEAKQMLAEAGYPNGFKMNVVCYTAQVDLLSIIKDYFSKVGVDLQIDVKEYGAYASIGQKKQYDVYMSSSYPVAPEQFSRDRIGNVDNYSMIADPKIEEAYGGVKANFFDAAKKAEFYRQIHPHMLEQAYYLVLPGPSDSTFWQPWLKAYAGERYVGTWAKEFNFPQWIWLDQDLKEKMTGRK